MDPTTGIAGVGAAEDGVWIGGRSAVGDGRSIASSSPNTTPPSTEMAPQVGKGVPLSALTTAPAAASGHRELPSLRGARSTRCFQSAAHPLAPPVEHRSQFGVDSRNRRGRRRAALEQSVSHGRTKGLILHYFPLWSWMITSASMRYTSAPS